MGTGSDQRSDYLGVHAPTYARIAAGEASGSATPDVIRAMETQLDRALRLPGAPSEGRLLELGCGDACLATALARRGDFDVSGVDVVPLAIELGRELPGLPGTFDPETRSPLHDEWAIAARRPLGPRSMAAVAPRAPRREDGPIVWRSLLLPFALLAWSVLSVGAAADTLLLEDGGFLRAVEVTKTEAGYDVPFPHGTISLAAKDVRAHYAADDPEGDAAAAEIEERSHWRNRRKESTACFRYESTLPEFLFARYRTVMDEHLRLVEKALGLSEVAGEPPLVCLCAGETMYRRISGASGSGHFKRTEPLELALFDDPTTRIVNLGVARWATAAYAVHRRWPALPPDFFLTQGLDDYYASLAPDPASPRGYRALVPGAPWFAIVWSRKQGLPVDLGRLFERRGTVHQGWRWGLVHFLLETDAYAAPFRAYLAEAPAHADATKAYHALLDALDLNDLEARGEFQQAWARHLDALEATTSAAAFVRAAELADYYGTKAREDAARLYAKAAEFPEGRRAGLKGLSELARHEEPMAEFWALRALLAEDPLDVEARCRLAVNFTERGAMKSGENEALLAQEIAEASGVELP